MNLFGTWVFIEHDTLQAPVLKLPEFSGSCCCTEKGRKETGPYKEQWLLMPGIKTFMSFKLFWNVRRSLLFMQVVLL